LAQRPFPTKITALIREYFSLTPKGIIETLDLRRQSTRIRRAYGHFGRSGPSFTGKRTDRADALRKAAGLEQQPRWKLRHTGRIGCYADSHGVSFPREFLRGAEI
jgi:hypothetical protein